MPGFSRMLAAVGGFDPALYEVCSAQAGTPAGPHGPVGALGHLDVCPYCAGQGTLPAPPPVALAWTPSLAATHVRSAVVASLPPDLRWRASAQPRAPPRVS